MAGGPGSGRRAEPPVKLAVMEALYRGLEERLIAGDPQALSEFMLRLDKARLRLEISGKQHQDLTKSAQVRGSLSAHVDAERRTKRLEEVAEAYEKVAGGVVDRDIGPPADDLGPADAGQKIRH